MDFELTRRQRAFMPSPATLAIVWFIIGGLGVQYAIYRATGVRS
jgi:hypothetical protein